MGNEKQAIDSERRAGNRRETQIAAILTDATGLVCGGVIRDISEEGCSITVPCLLVRDEIYSIKFAGLEMQAGFVAWTHDGRAGMEFLVPLNAATLEDIVQRFPSLPATGPGEGEAHKRSNPSIDV